MAEQVDFTQRVQALYRPIFVLVPSIYYFFVTLLSSPHVLLTRGLNAVRSAAFARFWLAYGYVLSKDISPKLTALLSTVHGMVLDIGPGTGDLVQHFDAAKIEMCYGIEPATELHENLRVAAKKAGFGEEKSGQYVVLRAGAEQLSLVPALAKAGLFAGDKSTSVFDEIICISSLCGVPTPAETCQGLYCLLKPGGRIVVYEHVLNQYNTLARISQAFFMFVGWKFWVGGCCLDRDTRKSLLDAGGEEGWKEVHLEVLAAYGAIPCIVGYLVKAG